MADKRLSRDKARYGCTDACGQDLGRISALSLRRALETPVEVCGDKTADYAQVFCCDLGIGIVRQGRATPTATFTLHACCPPSEVVFQGTEGREEAIKRFLALHRRRHCMAHPEAVAAVIRRPKYKRPRRRDNDAAIRTEAAATSQD